ncbi:uncharacterized protein K441DRAFT_537834 [Cenococcum geophilum 1.58]|uniref:uncharacterized protein n=1 Tax=Cenococcum geophilum 1.58 TaxID=794803 RepID=UPI0035900020|nr:hypothetical protein K441DRAFT_537834 [Cenococcum geophilum 1.58]
MKIFIKHGPRARDSCTSYTTENTDYLTIYSRDIIHGNISYYNILLDKHLNAKLIDFANLLINRFPLLALYLV